MPEEAVMVLRLLLAGGLGMVIGLERELAGKVAGFRTHLLVCLGAASFTLASIYAFGVDESSARVAAGVVTGIGLVTASGLYWLAGVATLLALIVLRFPEERLKRRRQQ